MRGVVVTDYGGADVVALTERAKPEPGRGEVRLSVAAAGLNFADIEKRRGNYPNGPTPPFVGGMEVAGRIDAVGEGVDREPGEFVAGFCSGAFAEYAVVDERRLVDVPPTLSATEAAGMPVQWFTAHNCLHEWGDLQTGETVLIHAAAGGVGSAAVQIAAAEDVTVIGTASTAAKLAFARERGADHGINYEDANVVDAVDELTDGRGVDLVLDGVGGSAFGASVEALADCGRILTFGMASGRPGTVATPRLFFSNNAVIGYHLEHGLAHAPERVLAARDHLHRLFESGAASVELDSVWSFEEAGSAYRRLENRESTGKIVLEP
jgi:NADPH2:quinone reductase